MDEDEDEQEPEYTLDQLIELTEEIKKMALGILVRSKLLFA